MNILFIQTGGTIDKDYPKTIKGYAFEIADPAVGRILKRISPSIKYSIKTLLKKDSQEISNTDRKMLCAFCNETKHDKIIITHGTDTMLETAKKLSVIKNKTIILTGAFRPEKFKDSDADFNVGMAVGAIEFLLPGVYIAMNGRVMKFDQIKRNLSTGQFVEHVTSK
jgi:L-asparaginase